MNDITRKRILRKLENLPDEVLYEIVDFIDFVEKRHGTGELSASPLQRLAEGVEDVLRAGKLPVSAIKGTMNVVGTAGKVVEGITSAGQTVLDEIQKVANGDGEVGKSGSREASPQKEPTVTGSRDEGPQEEANNET